MANDNNKLITDDLDIAYTIERHLMMYEKSENSTERHKVLWHTWNSNKRWLSQMLEWTLSSCPTYSRHNAVHADTVLYNIERILGEERIKMLSATDCFMVLHASYMHDIGMSITAAERQEMTKEDRFQDLIEKLVQEGDTDQRKAAQSVLRTQYTEYETLSSRERSNHLKDLFREKLDVYYGLGQLMAEYQRTLHAGRVKERMAKWTLNPEDLGNGFSASGIPLRLFLRIADCAAIHATSGIEAVLELPQKDSGYVLDIVHPRFIAIMLQLGDALDMDNDRFHPFAYQFAGNFPRTSTLHLKKHQAIRQLNITPELIQIQADCDSQDVLRMVRMECEGLDEILKNASYHWAEIAPSNMPGCLPTLNQQQILLDGQKVPNELVRAQFNISQVRAFRLLEGANVYGGDFVFLRELIQNAIDATKLQCWEDFIYKSKLKDRELLKDGYEMVEYGLNPSEKEILDEVYVWEYPIELYFEIGIQLRDKNEDLLFIPIEEVERHSAYGSKYSAGIPVRDKNEEIQIVSNEEIQKYVNDSNHYGIRVTIRDHGTGISKDDLIKISNVGSSYEEKKHFIDKMPDWLKPTGQFGIGLQSAFLVSDSIKARTYTRSGEKYEISFNKVSNGSGGYINVKPLPESVYVTFGTTFELFLDISHKKPHVDCWEAWNTDSRDADRFSSDYEKKRPLRHAMELLTQMVLSVDEMLGENIFPIYVYIRGKNFSVSQYGFIKDRVKKLALEGDVEKKWQEEGKGRNAKGREAARWSEIQKRRKHLELRKEDYIGWLFRVLQPKKHWNYDSVKEECLFVVDIKDGIGALDCRNAKLYIWNSVLGVFAQFGGKRLLSADSSVSKSREVKQIDENKIRICLKGIYVQSHQMYQDSELLELIDIKGGKIGKNHIAINRNEFTQEGIQYLEEEIYPSVITSAREALVELNEQANQQEEKADGSICFDELIEKAIRNKLAECRDLEGSGNEKEQVELEELVLSAVGLSYFLRVLGREPELLCEKQGKKEKCHWDELLERIIGLRIYSDSPDDADDDDMKVFTKYINHGMMREMSVFRYRDLNRNQPYFRKKCLDYPSLLLEKRKIAIISMRMDEHSKWFYIPIEVYDREEKGENYFDIFLRKANSYREEREIQLELEHWADGVWKSITNDINYFKEEYGEDSEIQYTLKYMLDNIPTVGVYASEDENLRMNVLSEEHPVSIFYNRNAKHLVLKKAQKLYDKNHAKRFVTGVWRSYECLSLEKIPSSVHVVNGVYVARQQTERMLLPVLGENIDKLLCFKEQDFYIAIKDDMLSCRELENICSDYINFESELEEIFCRDTLNDSEDNALRKFLTEKLEREIQKFNTKEISYVKRRAIARSYWQKLMENILEVVRGKFKEYEDRERAGENVIPRINELLIGKGDVQRKLKFQMTVADLYFMREDDIRLYAGKEEAELWEWFTKSLYFLRKYQRDEFLNKVLTHEDVERFKESLWGSDKENHSEDVRENIVNYVVNNSKQGLTEKQVKKCYEKMYDDIITSVIGNDMVNVESDAQYIDLLIKGGEKL